MNCTASEVSCTVAVKLDEDPQSEFYKIKISVIEKKWTKRCSIKESYETAISKYTSEWPQEAWPRLTKINEHPVGIESGDESSAMDIKTILLYPSEGDNVVISGTLSKRYNHRLLRKVDPEKYSHRKTAWLLHLQNFFFVALKTKVLERADIWLEAADIKNKSNLGVLACYKNHDYTHSKW